MRRPLVCCLAFAALAVSACSDAVAPTTRSAMALRPTGASLDESEGRGVFQRYVAIGTSLSMGWQSDGVIAATQETSWPAQLAAMGHRTMTQPYVEGTGCRSPLASPIFSGVRLSGEPAALDPSLLSCSAPPNNADKPVQNLAINAATTFDALYTTPENTTDAGNARLIAHVLQKGMTQVSSMVAQNPKLVSVELGGNEVLNARSGIVIPNITIVPFETWAPLYNAVLDQVQSVTREAVVVGLIDDVASFPAFRRGDEMWASRSAFAQIGVAVNSNCAGSPNLLFVPVLVPTAAATHALSCAAGGPARQDFILTPAEAGVVNALLAQMNAHIRGEAERRQLAFFALQELYGRSDVKGPFNVFAYALPNSQPYGPFISLDGVHPTAAGAQILAEAAARALDARYHHDILGESASVIAAR